MLLGPAPFPGGGLAAVQQHAWPLRRQQPAGHQRWLPAAGRSAWKEGQRAGCEWGHLQCSPPEGDADQPRSADRKTSPCRGPKQQWKILPGRQAESGRRQHRCHTAQHSVGSQEDKPHSKLCLEGVLGLTQGTAVWPQLTR